MVCSLEHLFETCNNVQLFYLHFMGILISVCLGSLIAGYSIAWSSPISRILSTPDYYPPILVISGEQMRWIFLWVPIGATMGALLAGLLADLIGRKLILLFSTTICTAAWIVTMLAEEVFILHLTRLILGITVGVYSVIVPLYVIEIAEDSIRGKVTTQFSEISSLFSVLQMR